MRGFVTAALVLSLSGVCGYLYVESSQPERDVIGEAKESIVIKVSEVKDDFEGENLQGVELQRDRCIVWGPFSGNTVKEATQALKKAKLFDKALVTDRFESDQFMAYLGPLENETAVRAFAKQFRQQGYRNVRIIRNGAIAPGVEISRFATEKEAYRFLTSEKAPRVQGIRVIKRLGNVKDEIDFTMNKLTTREIKTLEKIKHNFAKTTMTSCKVR